MKLKVLKRDLFFVSSRIKKINRNYFICYNKKKNIFEMHFEKQKGGTFCFTIGEKLTVFAIKKTFITQVKNAKKLFTEVDKINRKIEEEKQRKLTERHMGDFSLFIDYATRRAGEVDFKTFQDFKWI